jgi:transposase
VIAVPSAVRVWLAVGHTDMRRGMNGLALQVQQALQRDPHAGDLYVFRGKRGDLVKILWHDGVGMSLYAKRLERGRFISYGLCQGIWTCVVHRSVGTSVVGWTRSARVRTPSSRDGRSGSYAGVGHPMMTVRRRAAPLRPRT